jgi:NADH-quinone oxidoreductase subunit M
MASVALPGTAGFPGEFLVITGAWRSSGWVALGAAMGMILGAAYMLWLYRRVIFSRISRDEVRALLDLSPREIAVFAPLILLTLWMGVYPSSFLDVWEASVAALVQRHEAAMAIPRMAGL